jgi:hypothetical protein
MGKGTCLQQRSPFSHPHILLPQTPPDPRGQAKLEFMVRRAGVGEHWRLHAPFPTR